MAKRLWYYVWIGLFLVTACVGFLPAREGAWRVVSTLLAVLFFLPPAWILKTGDGKDAKRVFFISLSSLCLTVATIIVSVICARGSEALGNALHGLLVVVSAPMVCGGVWVLSLFLWACLLFASRGRFGKM